MYNLLLIRLNYPQMKTRIWMLLISSIAFAACKDEGCGPEITKEYPLSLNDHSKIVYKGNEKLTFIDSTANDTHVFIGQGYYTDYHFIKYQYDDCEPLHKSERSNLIFKNMTQANNDLSFMIGSVRKENSPQILIALNNTTIEVSPTLIANNNPNLFEMEIRGKKYSKLVSFYAPVHYLNLAYYDIDEGLVRMVTRDGHVWELISKDTL